MKIGVNIGHIGTQGAVGFLYETQCNTEIVTALIPMLKKAGHTVIDCSIPAKNGIEDYIMSTNYANTQSLDLLISVHCNSFSDPNANGTEVLYTGNGKGKEYAGQLSKRISEKLGTFNRSGKADNKTHIIIRTICPCVLIESFFVSNKNDCLKYDPQKIAEAIAENFGYTKGENNMFKDVPETHYAYKHIKKLKDYGIVNGDEKGNYNPDEKITRADVAIIVANALTICGK